MFHDTELLGILITSVLFAAAVFLVFRFLKVPKKKEKEKAKTFHLSFTHPSKVYKGYDKNDWRNLILITGLYAIVSFWQLGSASMPVTTWQPAHNITSQDIVFELDDDTKFDAIYTFYGEGDNNANPDNYQLGTQGMEIYGSSNNSDWTRIATLKEGSIYEYQITEGKWNFRYIWLRCTDPDNSLSEIGFRSTDHSHFLKLHVIMDGESKSRYPATLLIDEQNKLKMYPTYLDEAYFDEIYHPRNAWEIANGEDMYATVHPLFGTNLMALSIHFFGMNPLAWRLPGVLFGIMLMPMFYAVLKRLFEKTSLCTIGLILFGADFMHLTTSRIGTLEPFSVFFILLMFWFMIRYIQTSFYDTSRRKQLILLLLCGISMGVAISTKWTACYSAAGLAILLFTYWFHEYIEYRKARKFLLQKDIAEPERKEAERMTAIFPKRFWISFASCFVFFLFIPAVIYCLSYLPDRVWKGDTWSVANVWKQAEYMYNYHISLKATHPYSSTWNQWLFDIRPIWYYFGQDGQGLQHSISCFSNPLMTWLALPAIIFTLAVAVVKKDQSAWVIVIGYITALAPWIIIKRCVFAYHFYPTSFFAILSIVMLFQYMEDIGKAGKIFMLVYLILYVIVFLAFLPVTAGFGTTLDYIHSLEWFSTWYFG